MSRSGRRGKPSTPLDAKQQALLAHEEQLRQQMQRLERLIEEAPKRAEEEERRRREELITRASQSSGRWETRGVIPDKRYNNETFSTPRRRSLKAERREIRRKFFVLCMVLIALALWLWSILGG